MWPLYLIAGKFLKIEEEARRCAGGGGCLDRTLLIGEEYATEEEHEQPPPVRNHAISSSRSHFVDVPHVQQLCNWDCGLACVLMVLRTLGIDHCGIRDLEELCCTRSVWTVDLAHLLHKFSVDFSFFTVTFGVNPEFSVEAFYKEQLQDDLGRVDRLFEEALEVGISIQCRSLSGKDISVLILSGKYIAIALVDKFKLSYTLLKDICVSGCYNVRSNYIGNMREFLWCAWKKPANPLVPMRISFW